MQFIKTLFWVVLAVALVVFAVNNWSPVSVLVWDELRIDTKLPVLVIGAFLIGFLPPWLMHRTSRWRLSRRIKTLETAARPAAAPPSGDESAAQSKPAIKPEADVSTADSEPTSS